MVRKPHTYSLGLKGDGYAVSEYGVARIIDGCLILCDCNVIDLAREFEGKWVEIAICSPQPPDETPLDPHIEPLVRKLQDIGVTTISSCDGHMDHARWRAPFVATWGKPSIPVASTWEWEQIGANIYHLRAKGDATNQQELEALWPLIEDQLKVL